MTTDRLYYSVNGVRYCITGLPTDKARRYVNKLPGYCMAECHADIGDVEPKAILTTEKEMKKIFKQWLNT